MAKQLFQVEKELGGDGAKAAAGLSVSGEALELGIKVTYPLAKIVEPAGLIIDQLVDKLEALIPGDQKAMAAQAKADARAALVKALSEAAA